MPVDDREKLARFVVVESYIRRSKNTPRPQVFLPYKHVELSVIRHLDLSEAELWEIGQTDVADKLGKPLHGRADILASDVRAERLDVKPSEPPRNHANIIGWPPERAAQMSYAQVLASKAGQFIPTPTA